MFEWDEAKRRVNIEKHGIDFVAAKKIWQGRVIEKPSQRFRHGEERILPIGELDGRHITVDTWRAQNRRLISAGKET